MTKNDILDEHLAIKTFTLERNIQDFLFKVVSIINYLAPIYMIVSLIIAANEPEDDTTDDIHIFEMVVIILFLILPFIVSICVYFISKKIKILEKLKKVSLVYNNRLLVFFFRAIFPLTIIVNFLTIYTTYLYYDLEVKDFFDLTYYIYIVVYNFALYLFIKKTYKYLPVILNFDKNILI